MNGNEEESTKISAENLFTFFKKVNAGNAQSETATLFDTEAAEQVNEEINQTITIEEIEKYVKTLKNGKSAGIDSVLNEHIKSTFHILGPVYVKLFNIILDSGILPEVWTLGVIKPIYKQKGDVRNPENYRPITLVSCLGKLFTGIISSRLNSFAEKHDILISNQAGFRKGFSTADNIFVLYCLIEIMQMRKKKLFSAFIDLKQAFDTVWRDGLWYKLLRYDISGKCFRLINNMYSDIKSCLTVNGSHTNFFSCKIGLRQGENLSPFLFSVYLNDLESFFFSANIDSGVECFSSDFDESVYIYLKLFVLLYADDTVILSESANGLQSALDVYNEYCKQWKLTVNMNKSMVIVFSKGRHSNYSFTLNDNNIEVGYEYKYLGVLFSRSGSFFAAKKHMVCQAEKAMYSLIRKARALLLPIDLQIELFDKMVKPILLYGSEVWGFGNLDILERTLLKFLKIILSMKTSTPNFMVYGETGVFPLYIDIQCRVISFWAKLVTSNLLKLSTSLYNVCLSLYRHSDQNQRFKWIKNVRDILYNCGFNAIWDSQTFPNTKWLVCAMRQKLKDIFINKWYSEIENSSSGIIYRIFKLRFCFEDYLVSLPFKLRKSFMQIRTRNHRLPIECGRWENIAREERLCTLCGNEIGDEYHYILVCVKLKNIRKMFLPRYYCSRPNTLKFCELFNTCTNKNKALRKLCTFIQIILQQKY